MGSWANHEVWFTHRIISINASKRQGSPLHPGKWTKEPFIGQRETRFTVVCGLGIENAHKGQHQDETKSNLHRLLPIRCGFVKGGMGQVMARWSNSLLVGWVPQNVLCPNTFLQLPQRGFAGFHDSILGCKLHVRHGWGLIRARRLVSLSFSGESVVHVSSPLAAGKKAFSKI